MNSAFGFGIGVLAAVFFNAGLALQKKAALTLPAVGGGGAARGFLRSPLWLGGSLLMLAGWGAECLALRLAPVSLVFPSMPAGTAVLALFGRRWFGEELDRREWTGVALCLLGVVAAGLTASAGEGAGFTVSLPIVVGLVALVEVAPLIELARWRGGRKTGELGISTAAGLAFGGTGILTKALAVANGWGVAALIVLALAGLSAVGVALMQAAHQRGRVAVVLTLTSAISTAIPVAAGSLAFGEPWPAAGPAVARVLAFAAIVAGSALLARRSLAGPPADPRALS